MAQITDKDIPKNGRLPIKLLIIAVGALSSVVIYKDHENTLLSQRIETNKDIRAAEIKRLNESWLWKFERAQFKYDSSLTRIRDQFNNYILERAAAIEKQGKKIQRSLK